MVAEVSYREGSLLRTLGSFKGGPRAGIKAANGTFISFGGNNSIYPNPDLIL